MTAALNLTLSAKIEGYVRGANDLAQPEQKLAIDRAIKLAMGTVANQADQVFMDTRTLAASGSESLDLAGGLADAFGATLTMVEVVAMVLMADATNTNNVVVGGASSNAFVGFFGDATDKLVVKPGGMVLIAAPTNPAYPVVAATGDLLQIANSGGTTGVTYTIIIVARSA